MSYFLVYGHVFQVLQGIKNSFASDNELFPFPLGYGFSVKEFVEPFAILKICVKKRDPHMAVR